MAKIILVVVGLLLAWWILKRYRRQVDRRDRPPQAGGAEDMVRCAQCGVHLPRGESLTVGGHFYCSAEHRRQHEKAG